MIQWIKSINLRSIQISQINLNEALLVAGYAPDDELAANGLFSGYYELNEEDRKLARRQIAALIRSFKEEDEEK